MLLLLLPWMLQGAAPTDATWLSRMLCHGADSSSCGQLVSVRGVQIMSQLSAGRSALSVCTSLAMCATGQWCGLRPWWCAVKKLLTHSLALDGETVGLRTKPVSDQKKSVLVFFLHYLGPAGLVLFWGKRSWHARRHNDLEGHSNFSSTVLFIVSLIIIMCLEHHYCGYQQWHLPT